MKQFLSFLVLTSSLMLSTLATAQSTPCEDYTPIPYSTGFEGVPTDGLPNCWLQVQSGVNNGHTFPSVYVYPDNTRTGSCYFEFESSSSSSNVEIAALPRMENISTLQMNVWISSSSYYACSIEVGVLEDSVFVPVDTLNLITFAGSTEWKQNYHEYIITFENYTGTGDRIAIRATRTGSGQFTLFMDDLSVTVAGFPTLSLPEATTTNINTPLDIVASYRGSQDGLSFSWSSVMEANGDATLVASDTTATITYTAAGIDTIMLIATNNVGSDTAYMTIRAIDLNPVTTFPYTTGFEDGQDLNWLFFNGTNGWYIDTAAANTGSRGLYISNDNGQNNTYTTNSSTYSYAYRYFQLDAGEYAYNFNWRCAGESTYDYLYFYLATTTADFSGTSVSTSGWNNLSGTLNGQSTWQTHSGTFTITTPGLYPIVFYWRNDGSVGTQPPAAVDNFTLMPLTCPAVYAVTLDSAGQDQLTIHWQPLGTESEWAVSVNGEAPIQATDSFLTITNLTPNTLYSIAVSAVCGSGDTSIATTASFRTACSDMVLPYSADFESETQNTAPNCWNQVLTYTSGSVVYPAVTSRHHNGNNGLSLRSYNTPSIITTSAVPLAGNEIFVNFWGRHNGTSSAAHFTAGVMSNPADTSTFIPMVEIPQSSDFAEYEFNTSTLDASATYYVAFRYINTSSYYYADIDDLIIRIDDGCHRPDSLHVVSSDSVSLTIGWTVEGSFNGVAQYRVYNSTDWSTPEAVSSTTYTLSNLNSNTLYEIRIGNICNTDTLWRVISARTSCGQMSLPFFTDWEDIPYNGAWPSCWDSTMHHNTDPSVNHEYNHTSGGQYSMFLMADNDYNLVVSPAVPLPGNQITVNFWATLRSGYGTSWLKAGVMTNPRDTSTFIPLVEITNADNNFYEYEFSTFDLPASETYYVAWLYYATDLRRAGVDDVTIMQSPSCVRPRNVYVDSVSGSEAFLRWSTTPATTYKVAYGTVNDVEDTTVQTLTVNDTAVTLSGLDPVTQYFFWVRSDCGGGDLSQWQAGPAFTTDCATGRCSFTVQCDDSYGDGWNGNSVQAYQNNNLVDEATIATGNSATVVINTCLGTPVNVIWHQGSYANETSFSISDHAGTQLLSVDDGSDLTDGDTLVIFDATCTATFIYGLDSVPPVDTTPQPPIVVPCDAPTNLSATATPSSVSISFSGSADAYEVAILQGTTWNTSALASSSTITSTSHTFTGLTPNTQYTVGVRSNCLGDGDSDDQTSDWVTTTVSTLDSVTPGPGPTPETYTVTINRLVQPIDGPEREPLADEQEFCTVTGAGTYTEGSLVTVTAVENPANPHTFVSWTSTQGVLSTQPTFQFVITCDTVLTAHFALQHIGISDVAQSTVDLYPNPASDQLTITGAEGSQAILTDINGRQLASYAILQPSFTLSVANLAPGTYFLRFVNSNNTAVRKLVVR